MQTNANFDKDYVVRFNYYKATEGVNLKACCDDESNCPYGATPSVQTSDYRSWKTASIMCKAGTKKVSFHARRIAALGPDTRLDYGRGSCTFS